MIKVKGGPLFLPDTRSPGRCDLKLQLYPRHFIIIAVLFVCFHFLYHQSSRVASFSRRVLHVGCFTVSRNLNNVGFKCPAYGLK